MQYFQTDKNGFFIGSYQAEESPLEPGVFLIPRGGVVGLVPPAMGLEECARWNGAGWDVLPDLRGRVYWTADHLQHVVTERGIPLPAGAFEVDPPKTPAEIEAADSAAAKAELAAFDLASIRDIRAYIAAKADAPQTLKDREAAAVAARVRVRP